MLIIKKILPWKLLFETLLSTMSGYKPAFTVEIENDAIRLITNSEQDAALLVKHLNQVLSSRYNFLQNLPYKISSLNSQTTKSVATFIPAPDQTVSGLKQILVNLLGPRFEELAINLDVLFGVEAVIKDGVLFSKPALSKGIAKTWHEALNVLLRCFDGVNIETIRAAYLGKGALTLPVDSSTDDDTAIAKGLVQQCFGVQARKDDSRAKMYFDANCLYQLLAAPELKVNLQTKTVIDIDAHHLLMHIKQLLDNGPLLRIYKSAQDIPVLTPLFLGTDSPLSVTDPRIYTFVIDSSGSLAGFIDDIKRYLISSLEALAIKDPEGTVRLIFFADHKSQKDFKLSDLTKIREFINNDQTTGGTRLFDTINEELETVIHQQLTANNIVTFLVFSDGMDTSSTKTKSITHNTEQFKDENRSRFKAFTLGVGNVDQNTMTLLATTMGNSYIHLPEINKMNEVLSSLISASSFTRNRQLYDFFVELANQRYSYVVPVYEDNSPTLSDIKIYVPLTQKEPTVLSLNGNQYEVTINSENLPKATFTDEMSSFLSSARQMVVSEKSIEEKLFNLKNHLNHIRMPIATFYVEMNLYHEAVKEINYYINELTQAKFDNHRLSALITQVKSAQNLMNNDANSKQCASDGTCGPIHANGPELVTPTFSNEIIYHHFTRGRGAIENTLGYQLLNLPRIVINNLISFSSSNDRKNYCAYDGKPVAHPHSSEYVFNFDCGADNKLSLYGDLLPCSLNERNNILHIEGNDYFKNSIFELTQQSTCDTLPPGLLEIHGRRVLSSAGSGAVLGTLRGLKEVGQQQLEKKGIKSNTAAWIAKGLFYGTYMLTNLTITVCLQSMNSDEQKQEENPALKSAAINTSLLMAVECGLWAVKKGCEWSSKKANSYGYNKTANFFSKVGDYSPHLLLATEVLAPVAIEAYNTGSMSVDTLASGVESTAVAVGVGLMCEEGVKFGFK